MRAIEDPLAIQQRSSRAERVLRTTMRTGETARPPDYQSPHDSLLFRLYFGCGKWDGGASNGFGL